MQEKTPSSEKIFNLDNQANKLGMGGKLSPDIDESSYKKRMQQRKNIQAEDGIRDIAVSRGLGDVYKRQSLHTQTYHHWITKRDQQQAVNNAPVSYTHLTLPTNTPV